jgi:transposase-like protein
MITGIKCPYCKTPMRLLGGNPVFSYWLCKHCWMEYEYNAILERLEDEIKLTKKEREKYARS